MAIAIKRGKHDNQLPISCDRRFWTADKWKQIRLSVYCPVNASAEDLEKVHDSLLAERNHRPTSDSLNIWYTVMLEQDMLARITSSDLISDVVLSVDGEIAAVESRLQAEEAFYRATRILQKVNTRQATRGRPAIVKHIKRVPFYEGSAYW